MHNINKDMIGLSQKEKRVQQSELSKKELFERSKKPFFVQQIAGQCLIGKRNLYIFDSIDRQK